MAIRDTNGHAGVALAGGPEELWPVSGSEAAEPPDWRSLYERERERAEAAEARAEELRWAEVRARSDAGSVTVRSGRGEVFCRAGRGRAGLSG